MRSVHSVIPLALASLAAIAAPAGATMALLPTSSCSHTGNLVANGSFESGAPAGGTANKLYWATGTALTPFGVPPGWSSAGAAGSYATWGSDIVAPPSLHGSDTLPDGNVGLYFGDGRPAYTSLAPTFNSDGSVTFPGTPTMTSPLGAPVELRQTIPTHSSPAPSYCFSFWTSGEFASAGTLGLPDGIFGLRVTNVIPGNPMQFFTVPGGASALGMSHRYHFNLVPLNPLAPIDIEFYNWGHFDLSAYGVPNYTTELVLDHVMINQVPEPTSVFCLCIGSVLLLRRPRRCGELFQRRRGMHSLRLVLAVVPLAIASLIWSPRSARATMTLLTSSSCSHTGNLVTNGSFETGAPAPGTANKVYWATGTTFSPFGVPPGWTSSGAAGNYALWGDDTASPPRLASGDVLPDGLAGLYFGNGYPSFSSQAPTYHPDGRVTFSSPPTLTSKYGAPVMLSQTIPTNTNLAPNYCFDFWTSGEFADGTGPAGNADGIFGLRVTNVLAGDPLQYFAVTGGTTALGMSHRYIFDLVPLNPSNPITIEFYNWGHFDLSAHGGPGFTSELILDDVMINALPEPTTILCLCIGSIFLLRRPSMPLSRKPARVVLLGAIAAFLISTRAGQAAFVLNTGPQIATHTGNLVTNGSFETGGVPGFSNQQYWATGTSNTPFAVPTGWSSSGAPSNYALWGSTAPGVHHKSDTIPDGQVAMYFGNDFTVISQPATHHPDGTVTFPSPPTFTPNFGAPVRLSQTINTPANPAPQYVLNFWVSGEGASASLFPSDGIMGLKVTNVLAGDPLMYFAIPSMSSSPSRRYEFFFTPLNSSLPVTIEFTNWGHFIASPNVYATELVLDDVIVNPLPEPGSLGLVAVGSVLPRRRRPRI